MRPLTLADVLLAVIAVCAVILTVHEWFCDRCRRWVNGLCCPGCLQIDPASARWATRGEIDEARREVLAGE